MRHDLSIICINKEKNNKGTPDLELYGNYIIEDISYHGFIKIKGYNYWFSPNKFISEEQYNNHMNRKRSYEQYSLLHNRKSVYDNTRRKKHL